MSRKIPEQQYEKTISYRFRQWLDGTKDPFLGTVEMKPQKEFHEDDTAVEKRKEEKKEITTNNDNVKIEDKYVDDNPIKLGIFLVDNNYHNKSVIKDTYYANFTNGNDIASFEVFYTGDEVIDGTNFKNTWNTYYDKYTDIDNYKIGYNIKFILNDGTSLDNTFLKPDIFYFAKYFYVYFYDDIHQKDGTMYSHLEEVNDNTLMTSIKIYAVDGIDNVQNIILTAFTYDDEDDFDDNGNYRGSSSYTIEIKRK